VSWRAQKRHRVNARPQVKRPRKQREVGAIRRALHLARARFSVNASRRPTKGAPWANRGSRALGAQPPTVGSMPDSGSVPGCVEQTAVPEATGAGTRSALTSGGAEFQPYAQLGSARRRRSVLPPRFWRGSWLATYVFSPLAQQAVASQRLGGALANPLGAADDLPVELGLILVNACHVPIFALRSFSGPKDASDSNGCVRSVGRRGLCREDIA
jgi:hypothetical protein